MRVNERRLTAKGKAATLRQLQQAGFHVPAFTVIAADCEDSRLSDEVARMIAELGLPLAVRSSASAEDGARCSFAGQFESYLNLSTAEAIESAVRQCRSSLQTPLIEDYCRANRIMADDLQMDIIVQRMIQPELAGVVFTINPVTGLEEVTIEATAGLGGELLAGRESAIPADSALLLQHRSQIINVAYQIAEHFGCPQDIEFAVQDGIVWILQSRPITRIGSSGISGEWTNANFREGGVSSRVCSPLMWSIYDLVWDSSLNQCLKEIKLLSDNFDAGMLFFGRPYWNLGALKQCLTRIPGFVEREFDTDIGIEITYEGNGICTPATPWNMIKIVPTALAIRRFIQQQTAASLSLLNGGYEIIHRRYEVVPDDPETTFEALIEGDYLNFETNYFRTIFALSLAKLDFKHFFPNVNFPALMSNLAEVRHTAPMRRIEQMAQLDAFDPHALLAEFGHHYHVGLDICHPRWDEDQQYVESLLNHVNCTSRPTTNDTPHGNSADVYLNALNAARSSIPTWQRPIFHSKLKRLRHLVWLREELRDQSNRLYHLIRKHVLRIALNRGLGDDIFLMTYREILDDDRSNVQRRQLAGRRFRNFTPPNELGRSRTSANSHAPISRLTSTLRGLSASPGIVKGTARIVRTAREAVHLPADSIIVSPHTDPGWTAALSRVAGVITESGGMLSHAAVICREFALPAVLSVPNACARIPDGSSVILYGDEGIVELLE